MWPLPVVTSSMVSPIYTEVAEGFSTFVSVCMKLERFISLLLIQLLHWKFLKSGASHVVKLMFGELFFCKSCLSFVIYVCLLLLLFIVV